MNAKIILSSVVFVFAMLLFTMPVNAFNNFSLTNNALQINSNFKLLSSDFSEMKTISTINKSILNFIHKEPVVETEEDVSINVELLPKFKTSMKTTSSEPVVTKASNYVSPNSTVFHIVVTDDAGNPIPNAVVDLDPLKPSTYTKNDNYWYRGYAGLTDAEGKLTLEFDYRVSDNEKLRIQVPRVIYLDGKFTPDEFGMVGPYGANTTVYQLFGSEKSAYFMEDAVKGQEVTVYFKLLTGTASYSFNTNVNANYNSTLLNYPDMITSDSSALILDAVNPYGGCVETVKFANPVDFGEAWAGWECVFSVSEYHAMPYSLDFVEVNGTLTANEIINMNHGDNFVENVTLE